VKRSVRINIAANFAGAGWSALMSVCFVPVYITYLGMEAYAVIGLFAVLQVWMSLLDFGLGPTLNREMARLQAGWHTAISIRNLFRSAELVCFSAAGFIAFIIFFASEWLARDWLRPEHIETQNLAAAISLGGITLALRWVAGLYRNAILGLQEQVWVNVVTAAYATIRGVGAIGVLALVSPTLTAFFAYQILVVALELGTVALIVYVHLPRSNTRARFSVTELRKVWRFSAGVAGISALTTVLTQSDKLILSKLLSLSQFGHYVLAGTIATTLLVLVVPVSTAVGPRLIDIVSRGDCEAVASVYHRYSQLVSILVIPSALTLAIFSDRVLLLWTHDAELTAAASPLVTILVLGTMCNAFMNVPYLLQLAFGWTRFSLIGSSIAVALLLPALVMSASYYGAIGSASIWLILNAGYVVIGMPFMHRSILRGELSSWFIRDMGIPLLCGVAVVLLARLAISRVATDNLLVNACLLLLIFCLSSFVVGVSTPLGRSVICSSFGGKLRVGLAG